MAAKKPSPLVSALTLIEGKAKTVKHKKDRDAAVSELADLIADLARALKSAETAADK